MQERLSFTEILQVVENSSVAAVSAGAVPQSVAPAGERPSHKKRKKGKKKDVDSIFV